MHITLRQYEYFLALAETGQVSKAALQCHVSQSTVTVALRNMEHTLNTSLFTRHAKGLRLTDTGERFVHHARSVTNAAARAMEDIQTTPSDIEGRLRIGMTETISAYLMPRLLVTIEQRFPGLDIQMVETSRQHVERDLRQGKLDLGLLLVSNLRSAHDLEYSTILTSTRRLWTHPEHPLQKLKQVSLHDIAAFDYVLLDMDEHAHTMGRYWSQQQLRPRIHFQSQSLEAIRSLVAYQKGVTILSDLVYRPWSLEGRRILRRDVLEAIPSMDVGVVWNKKNPPDPGQQALMQFLHATIRGMTQDAS